ncbi:tetratricopeptide repeat protein [Polynucleobacter sp. MWH-UH25E]|uniref:tetratricopeptide repeat protein n=1 Tax=Polynucleobacter sp. MWH-UH25E TaxID=1855616 RepID=UPI001BFD6BC3|nr:tetratricopeptide repeat protein [Polynucleobacter sp. MWH-UH25E]QWD61820.1 tetratricopeptide repeat protein [Polynucleobacter sp. MWH-UH25E]
MFSQLRSSLTHLQTTANGLVKHCVKKLDYALCIISLSVLTGLVLSFNLLISLLSECAKKFKAFAYPFAYQNAYALCVRSQEIWLRETSKIVRITLVICKLFDDGLVYLGKVTLNLFSIPVNVIIFVIRLTFMCFNQLGEDLRKVVVTGYHCMRDGFNAALNISIPLMKPSMYGAILATAIIGTTSNADVADEMKVLIEQKKSAEAYALGSKHPELMGDPLFDYFYGVAATETGHVSMGVLSLERVLLNDPNNDLVRLELARAYYAQGEYLRAKDEFLAVKKNQPPAGVVSTINVYLDDIKAKEGMYKATYGFYVELGMGYNNNVNAATAVNNIILPYIGPITLGASSLPQKSVFGYDSIGANFAMPITSDVSVFANANTSAQRYSQVNGYNLNVTNATTGVKITDGPNTYKIAGFGSIAQIDQVPVPNTYGAGGEYVRQLTDTQSAMLAVGSTVLQYPSQFNAYNSNLNIVTAGYRKAFPTVKWKPVLDAALSTSHQTDTSNRPDLGRKINGATLQASFLPTDKFGITLGAGYAQSKYDANDLLYQAARKDNLYSGNAVLQYKLTKELSARMEFTYYNNQSNLVLYGYEQWTGAIKLRYAWDSN